MSYTGSEIRVCHDTELHKSPHQYEPFENLSDHRLALGEQNSGPALARRVQLTGFCYKGSRLLCFLFLI